MTLSSVAPAAPVEQVAVPARYPIARILISGASYATATASILCAARAGRSLVTAATSVHGLTLGAIDNAFGSVLNSFEILTPDGQPVRWGLNLLHGLGMPDRVYGPTLMLRVCEAAAQQSAGIYLYGGRPEVLARLVNRLTERVPDLQVAGFRSPPFRPLTAQEDAADVRAILESGARIVFVGLGCPRQEQWAAAHLHRQVDRSRRSRRRTAPGPRLDAGSRPRVAVPSAHRAAPPLAPLRQAHPDLHLPVGPRVRAAPIGIEEE